MIDLVDTLTTPDGRYLVVRGRLWRCSDPRLPETERDDLVHELMSARRDKGAAGDDDARKVGPDPGRRGQAGARRARFGVVGRRCA